MAGYLVSAASQLIKASQFFFYSIPWFWLAVAAWLYAQPLSCYVTRSRPRGDLCLHGQADVWGGIYFICRVVVVFRPNSYFAVKCSPQAEVPHQWSHKVAESQISSVVVKQWLAKDGQGQKVQSGRVEGRGVPTWSK